MAKRKSASPTKRRGRSVSKGPRTPKKSRSKSRTKTPGTAGRGRSRTPSRSAPHKKTASPRARRGTTPKKADTPVTTSVARMRRALPAISSTYVTSAAAHPASTLSNLMNAIRRKTCGTSPMRRTGRQPWYVYCGYNIPMCALMLAMIVCVVFAGYHYRSDLNSQVARLRARFFKH